MTKPTPKDEIELDAWGRFERAVDVVAKSPPQHRKGIAKKKKSPDAKRQKKTNR
jgi:hypothetical protein